MIQTRRSPGRSLTTTLLALLLVLSSSLVTVAQSPSPSPDPSAGTTAPALDAPTLGGVLADEEGRAPTAPPKLLLGTKLDGLALVGPRTAFRPGETFAYRLELPVPVNQIRLAFQLSGSVSGVDALWSYPDQPVDPTWDTVVGTLTAPPVGDYVLRVFGGQKQLAEVPLAVRDVPRLTSLLTDPLGLVATETERVAAAGKRYEDATGGGWLWNVLIDTTGDIPVSEWTADLWAVNADQIDPRDALFVAAAGDIDVAIIVGSVAGRTIVREELAGIEDAAVFDLGDGRFGDMIDGVADGLVIAHQEGPQASPTATPRPTPSPTPATVRVPDFVGLSRDEAELLAARRGLETRITFRQTSEVARGTVVAQDPRAGRAIESGGTVTLVVAATPRTIAVPNVAGLSEEDAVGVLLDSGLEPGARIQRYSEAFSRGDVIRTDPKAGTQVLPGSVVDYVVSRGPSPTPSPTPRPTATVKPTPGPVEVPNVRGETEEDAIARLLDAGLEVGDRFRRSNASIPAGLVIRTDPAAGTFVARGTRIDYFVSTGPPPALPTPTPTPQPTQTPRPTAGVVEVPNVRGETENDAIARLLDARLEIGDRFRRANANIPEGSVIRTDPAAGTIVAIGTRIDYFVSTGPAEPTPAPTPTPRPTAEPSAPATGDRLDRILASRVLRVNVAEDDRPWSYVGSNGGRSGYDPAVARAIGKRLDVTVEFTTFPLDEVRAGIWDDRFDIAISRLAITATDPALLEFSSPYGYDPQQLSVTAESGLTSVEELVDRAICVDQSDTGMAWLDGTLALVSPPLEPALPPSGAVGVPGPTNADCLAQIAIGGAPFDGWLASLPTVMTAIDGGAPIGAVGAPVFWAPVGVAFDAAAADNASLIAAVNDILFQLLEDGTLAKSSLRFLGLDVTVVPEDGVPIIVEVASSSPAPAP